MLTCGVMVEFFCLYESILTENESRHQGTVENAFALLRCCTCEYSELETINSVSSKSWLHERNGGVQLLRSDHLTAPLAFVLDRKQNDKVVEL